jgi:hypothetical protein
MTAKLENIFAKPVPVIWGDTDVKDTHIIIPDSMSLLQQVLLMQSWAVGSIENHKAYPLWSKQAREGMAEFFTAEEAVKNNYKASGGLGKSLVQFAKHAKRGSKSPRAASESQSTISGH